jgi:hypothetical protein
MHSKI